MIYLDEQIANLKYAQKQDTRLHNISVQQRLAELRALKLAHAALRTCQHQSFNTIACVSEAIAAIDALGEK
jgi:hypothetical protein